MNVVGFILIFLLWSTFSFGKVDGFIKPQNIYFSLTLDYGKILNEEVKKTYYSTTPFVFHDFINNIIAIEYNDPATNKTEIIYIGINVKRIEGFTTQKQFENAMKKEKMAKVQMALNIAMEERNEKDFRELLEVYKKENPKFPQEFWDRWSIPNEYWEHWTIK